MNDIIAVFRQLGVSTVELEKAVLGFTDSVVTLMDSFIELDATPDMIVDWIVGSPNHTWRGLTIYPDEAWRYRGKSDWIWWRKESEETR